MKETNNGIDPRLEKWLDEIRAMPPRDPSVAARGRARFLTQVISCQRAISKGQFQRLKEWKINFRKEKLAMNPLIATLIILGLVFGGSAGTVYAAQDDLPNNALYPVKTFSEDARLWFNADPETEIDILLALVRTRVQEMTALVAMGLTPPASVALRLDKHIQQALQTATGMDDDEMPGALLRIQTELQYQEQLMLQLQTQASGEEYQFIAQVRTMLEIRIRMVEDGIADPQGFQNAVRQESEFGQTTMPWTDNGQGPYGGMPDEPGTPGGNDNGQGPNDQDASGPPTEPGQNPNTEPGPSGNGGQGDYNP